MIRNVGDTVIVTYVPWDMSSTMAAAHKYPAAGSTMVAAMHTLQDTMVTKFPVTITDDLRPVLMVQCLLFQMEEVFNLVLDLPPPLPNQGDALLICGRQFPYLKM
jgi:hypothetical protein